MRYERPIVSFKTLYQHINWLDGREMLDVIEPYRMWIFEQVFDETDENGYPRYNFVLCGRAKKNWKSTDLVLAALYVLYFYKSAQGNDVWLLANDQKQAEKNLDLVKKLIDKNPILSSEAEILQYTVRRKDARGNVRGILSVLPAGDVRGAHGGTAAAVFFDEIHGYKDHSLFEALAPDPTRPDALTMIASYDTLMNRPGVPMQALIIVWSTLGSG